MNAPEQSANLDGDGLLVGIDIGGTGTRFVALDPSDGSVLAKITEPTPKQGTAADVRAFLSGPIRRVTRGRRASALGIGASGPIDAHGVIQNPDTLPALTGLPILDLLDRLSETAVIENDAVCAAIGERVVGAARGARRSLHVTLGTGIGVCLLDGDEPFRNPDGAHPEAGHISTGVPTDPCYCGRAACWEQAASRRRLQRLAAVAVGTSATDPAAIGRLADRAKRGEREALDIFDDYGRALADGLATVITVYGPDLVVIGGSVAAHYEHCRTAVDDALDRLRRWLRVPEIRTTRLDDYGGAVGAAHLAGSARPS